MNESFSFDELKLMYSLTHECIYMNNRQLDSDASLSLETRNDIIDENKIARHCWRKLRAALASKSPEFLSALDASLPSLD